MAEKAQTESKPQLNQKWIIILLLLLLLLMGAVLAVVLLRDDTQSITDSDTPLIGYADASVFLDEAALQAAFDEASRNAANSSVALWYKNNAFSDDGTHFDCFIGNSARNLYDMFLTIYADAEMTDQLFLSGLIRPGSGFEQIELGRALDPGVTVVYVAATLVDTAEDGTQTIQSQVIHTMDFNVSE